MAAPSTRNIVPLLPVAAAPAPVEGEQGLHRIHRGAVAIEPAAGMDGVLEV